MASKQMGGDASVPYYRCTLTTISKRNRLIIIIIGMYFTIWYRKRNDVLGISTISSYSYARQKTYTEHIHIINYNILFSKQEYI